ncbi:hypothetical protein Tco_0027979, partial [Tanacetum coccineum]
VEMILVSGMWWLWRGGAAEGGGGVERGGGSGRTLAGKR